MLKFYGFNTINSLKVLMFLLETKLKYEFIPVDIRAGEQHQHEFQRVNPAGKIPVLVENDQILTESNSILLYLANKTGWGMVEKPGFQAELISWLFYQASTQGPYFGQVEYWSGFAKSPNPEALAQYLSIANRTIDYLNGQLEGKEYLCGDNYSIADIALFPWLSSHEQLGLSLENADNLARWVERIRGRPATSNACDFFGTSTIFRTERDQ